jgi:hypothetical protein
MNDIRPVARRKTHGPRSMLARGRTLKLGGEVTYITIPSPPPSAMNKNRPISGLIGSQLQHMQHAESARLPKNKRLGIDIKDIHTEAEAASYIAAITKLLHPQGRKRSRPKSAS